MVPSCSTGSLSSLEDSTHLSLALVESKHNKVKVHLFSGNTTRFGYQEADILFHSMFESRLNFGCVLSFFIVARDYIQ